MSDVKGSYQDRLQQLNLTTLEERRSRGDAIEVFKWLKGFLDVDRDSIFAIKEASNPRTRHDKSFMPLVEPHARLDLRKNFFCVRGAKLWNCLPPSVRSSNSINAFKNAYNRTFNGS